MADNFSFTQGSGSSAASDVIGGVHFQRVKLTAGADSENQGDVGGAVVESSRVAVYTRNRPNMREFTPTVTVNTAAYTAGDCVGGKITVANVVAAAGDVFRLNRILLISMVNYSSMKLLIFNDDPSGTTFTDHAAFPSVATADFSKLRYAHDITPATAFGGVYVGQESVAGSWDLPDLTLVGTSLYVAMQTTGTPDWVNATDFKLVLAGERL